MHLVFGRLQLLDEVRIVGVATGADLGQLAVQVDNVRAACAFVQVINVLRHYGDVEVFLQSRHSPMSLVGLHFEQLTAALVVEVDDQFGIARIAFGRGHLLHRITVPQPARIAERTDTTLGTHACTRQNNQILHNLFLSLYNLTDSYGQK